MVQQVEASVVLLGEVNIGHDDKDLDDISEIFSDGIMERCVPVRILTQKKKTVNESVAWTKTPLDLHIFGKVAKNIALLSEGFVYILETRRKIGTGNKCLKTAS